MTVLNSEITWESVERVGSMKDAPKDKYIVGSRIDITFYCNYPKEIHFSNGAIATYDRETFSSSDRTYTFSLEGRSKSLPAKTAKAWLAKGEGITQVVAFDLADLVRV